MLLNLSNLIITKVYSATTMFTEKNARMQRTNRPSWAIILKYEGETVYTSNDEKYISNIENMVILPKGVSYDWHCTKAGHYCVIEFDSDITYDKILSFKIKNHEKILKIFKGLEYKRLIQKNLYELESICDTYSIILRLSAQNTSAYVPSKKKHRLDTVIEYISKNYMRNIKNDDLANLVGCSNVYFRKLFKEIYGTSPINYIKNIRMNKAKEMLRTDYSAISDIAVMLGYSSVYDFSRDFKKHVGVSPSQFYKDPNNSYHH